MIQLIHSISSDNNLALFHLSWTEILLKSKKFSDILWGVKFFQKKMFESGTKILIISNEEIEDIMTIDTSLEDSTLITQTIKMKQKSKGLDFLVFY